MKSVISTTFDDKYLFFLPIVTWCWNKLGIDVICFMPDSYYNFITNKELDRLRLILETVKNKNLKLECIEFRSQKNKEITYSQCSRLYAACLDLPEDEILITSDIDMVVFDNLKKNIELSYEQNNGMINMFGVDLVPKGQVPICYVWGFVREWRNGFKWTYGDRNDETDYETKTYQQYLDELLGGLECEDMKGNYWSKDQEEMKKIFTYIPHIQIPRSNGKNQFAMYRYDRDDTFLLDKLSLDTIDFHMPRPGYQEKNFDIILKVLKYHYPNDSFQWLIDYTTEFKKLL